MHVQKAIRHAEPRELVQLLARAKADAIQAKMRAASEEMQGFLLTCDQVCSGLCSPHLRLHLGLAYLPLL